jgi:hypothetical protein
MNRIRSVLLLWSLAFSLSPSGALAADTLERVGEAKMKQLQETYMFAETAARNVPSNQEVVLACIDQIFSEWEKAYFNLLYRETLNIAEMRPALEIYGAFLESRVRDRKLREALIRGIYDEVASVVQTKRRTGQWGPALDAAAFSIGDIQVNQLNAGFKSCIDSTMASEIQARLPEADILEAEKAANHTVVNVTWDRSPSGGITVQIKVNGQIEN